MKITTPNANEARDLFIRLQSGLPLTGQEKRDAWPGSFTDFILKLGGKPGITRYPGHEFFRKLIGGKGTRGETRQLAAQIAILFFSRRDSGGDRFTDINARAIDDFYYKNLDFNPESDGAKRLQAVLERVTHVLGDGKILYVRPTTGNCPTVENPHKHWSESALLPVRYRSFRVHIMESAASALMRKVHISRSQWST